MRTGLYIMGVAMLWGAVATAQERTFEPEVSEFAKARQLMREPATELDGIAALAILAHDPKLPAEDRLQAMQAIAARHAAAGRAPALADTVDTTLHLFPELDPAQAFQLRLVAGRELSDYALALPEDDAGRPRLLTRAQAYLKSVTLIHRGQRAAPELAAEAMYWLLESHSKSGNNEEAYRTAKRLLWDYPESPWAQRARLRYSDD